jgi:hypothetical protein
VRQVLSGVRRVPREPMVRRALKRRVESVVSSPDDPDIRSGPSERTPWNARRIVGNRIAPTTIPPNRFAQWVDDCQSGEQPESLDTLVTVGETRCRESSFRVLLAPSGCAT